MVFFVHYLQATAIVMLFIVHDSNGSNAFIVLDSVIPDSTMSAIVMIFLVCDSKMTTFALFVLVHNPTVIAVLMVFLLHD